MFHPLDWKIFLLWRIEKNALGNGKLVPVTRMFFSSLNYGKFHTVTKLKVKFPYIHRVTQTTTSHARKNFPPLGRGFYLHSTGQLKNLRKFPENIVIHKMHEQGMNQRPLDYNPNTLPLHHRNWCLKMKNTSIWIKFLWTSLIPVIIPSTDLNTLPAYKRYKNRMSGEINIPVSTRELSIYCKVIFQRAASYGSLFVTV